MKLLRDLLLVVAAAGILGFLSCFVVGATADRRLNAHPEYSEPSAQRTVVIRTKYHDGFVEPSYAQRLDRSEKWYLYFWIMILVGSLGWFALKGSGSKKP
jgi:hypothetical protein